MITYNPRVSIITVVYNNADFIEGCIQSVLSQSYSNIEYLIIDGGSNDGTLEIIEKYRDQIDVVLSEPDKGLYDAMNKGYELANGEIIGLLNSDDLFYDHDCIQEVVNTFELNQNTDIVYGDLVYVKRDDTSNIVRYWKSQEFHDKYFKEGLVPAHPSVYVKAEVAKKYQYDLSYKLVADYDWLLRIFDIHKVVYLPKKIVRMRLGGVTSKNLRNIIKGNLEIARSWKRHKGIYPLVTLLYKRPKNKIKQFKSVSELKES